MGGYKVKFLNYEEVLDYEPLNKHIIGQLWDSNKRHVVLYCGEHILFNEYAKTIDMFMEAINTMEHNNKVLIGNRINKEKMESAIKSFEYINEIYEGVDMSTKEYEMWLMYKDCIRTMMENSGHYKLSIFNVNGDDLCESLGD